MLVFKRRTKRARLRRSDRLLWVLLRRVWPLWANPLPIGRLSLVSTAALNSLPKTSTTYRQYDANGRVLASQETIGTQSPFNFSYTYNDQNLDTETYPSGRAVQTCYDSAGCVIQLNGTSSAWSVPYANLGYTLSGGTVTTTNTMGNQLVETDTTNVRLQTTGIQVGSLMTLGFNYGTTNNNGNLLSQTITRGSQTWTQTYGYDTLNRIACATETPNSTGVTCNPTSVSSSGANWYRVFGADPWANEFVTSNSNSTLALNSFTPTAPTDFDSTNHLQPASTVNSSNSSTGNQTAIGGYTFGYDAENRMTSSTLTGSTAAYVYDGSGHRVMKTLNAGTPNALTTTYVYDAMGQLIAEYGNPSAPDFGTKYLTADHLGSTRLVTDAAQNQEICYDYLPFGELIPTGTDGRAGCYGSTATPLTQKFTGKEREGTEAASMDYFQARYFSAYQQRFTSVDPRNASAALADPQRWNGYSYVRNLPTMLTDPHGLSPACYVDGFQTPCAAALGSVHSAAAEQCPNNVCPSPLQQQTQQQQSPNSGSGFWSGTVQRFANLFRGNGFHTNADLGLDSSSKPDFYSVSVSLYFYNGSFSYIPGTNNYVISPGGNLPNSLFPAVSATAGWSNNPEDYVTGWSWAACGFAVAGGCLGTSLSGTPVTQIGLATPGKGLSAGYGLDWNSTTLGLYESMPVEESPFGSVGIGSGLYYNPCMDGGDCAN